MKKLWVCALAAGGLVFGGCMREEKTDAYGGSGYEGVRGAQETGNQPVDQNRPPSDSRELERNDGSGQQGSFGQHESEGTGGSGVESEGEQSPWRDSPMQPGEGEAPVQDYERENKAEGGVRPQ